MAARILVVDDDPDILDAITIILQSQGYEVVTARNGVEALATLKARRPDLMVLDLLMPKMDGFAVCQELRSGRLSECSGMPLLVLTSVREEASRRRYELENGVHLDVEDYLEKPIAPEILLERVRKFLKKQQKVGSGSEQV